MKILDIALNDTVRSFRSLFAVGMMFIAPLLIAGLLYMAFSGMRGGQTTLPEIRLVIDNQDQPVRLPDGSELSYGQALVDMAYDPSVAGWLKAQTAGSEAAARAAVERQEAGVALLIPPGFSSAMLDGKTRPVVRIVHDPTLTIGPMVIENMVSSLLDGGGVARVALVTAEQRSQALGLPPDGAKTQALLASLGQWFVDFKRTLYHSEKTALLAVAPTGSPALTGSPAPDGDQTTAQRMLALGLIGQIIFFGFYTGSFSMMSILRDQEEGTLARLFTTPTDRTLVLAGKMLAVVLMVLIQGLVMLAAGRLLFGIRWGQPVTVLMAMAGQVAAASGLGVLLISLVKNTRQAGPILGGGLTMLAMLGGLFTTSVANMPRVFDQAGQYTPTGWVLNGWKAAMNGGGPADAALPLAVTLALGIVMFAAGAALFRRRFA